MAFDFKIKLTIQLQKISFQLYSQTVSKLNNQQNCYIHTTSSLLRTDGSTTKSNTHFYKMSLLKILASHYFYRFLELLKNLFKINNQIIETF